MAITAAMVKELRESTGAGMMDAKKALTETDGDFEAAVDWLRTKGLAKAAKKSGRVAAEGLVAIAVDGGSAVAVEVNSETDFVAKNEVFTDFCENLSVTCLTQDVQDVSSISNLNFSGTEQKVGDVLTDLIAKLGENITINRFVRFALGEQSN